MVVERIYFTTEILLMISGSRMASKGYLSKPATSHRQVRILESLTLPPRVRCIIFILVSPSWRMLYSGVTLLSTFISDLWCIPNVNYDDLRRTLASFSFHAIEADIRTFLNCSKQTYLATTWLPLSRISPLSSLTVFAWILTIRNQLANLRQTRTGQ
jgi:hypothetical protein